MQALASSIEQWPSDPFWIFLLYVENVSITSQKNTEVQAKDYKWILCGGVFEQLARYTMKYQESDLHLAFILLNLLKTSTYPATFSVPPTSLLFSTSATP